MDPVLIYINSHRNDRSTVISHSQIGILTTHFLPQDISVTSEMWKRDLVEAKSSLVHVIDGIYLTTDPNDTKRDNLGNLPTF